MDQYLLRIKKFVIENTKANIAAISANFTFV